MTTHIEPHTLRAGRSEPMAVAFRSANFEGEMEALAVKALLDANGIPAILSGPHTLPNLAFEIQVPEHLVATAEQLIRDSRQDGRHAADAAEAADE